MIHTEKFHKADDLTQTKLNKTELIRALVHHFKPIDVRKNLLHSIIITGEEKTWYITKDGILETPGSNYLGADTRIILEAVKSDGPVIVKAADTDILVLMYCVHSHERKTNQSIMQINSERFVSFNSIVNHYVTKVCNVLPAYHSITGCNISYSANVNKIKPHKNMIRPGKENLRADLVDLAVMKPSLRKP